MVNFFIKKTKILFEIKLKWPILVELSPNQIVEIAFYLFILMKHGKKIYLEWY